MLSKIRFKCPTCGREHTRGFFMSFGVFRCLHCGYQGHGFSADAEIDKAVFAEHQENNEWNRAHGIPEVPLGVDNLNGPG